LAGVVKLSDVEEVCVTEEALVPPTFITAPELGKLVPVNIAVSPPSGLNSLPPPDFAKEETIGIESPISAHPVPSYTSVLPKVVLNLI
jgi:hypothetical protein